MKNNCFMYYNEKDSIVTFELEPFVRIQKLIAEKFPPNGIQKDIDKFDKLLLQSLEEIFEIKIARNPEEVAEEVIDLMMYLGSLYNTMKDYSKEIEIPKHHFNVTMKNNKDIMNGKLYDVLDYVENSLFSIRRQYPERKWHKEYNISSIDKEKRFNTTLYVILECIKKVAEVLFEMVLDEERLIELINYKQNYILSINNPVQVS